MTEPLYLPATDVASRFRAASALLASVRDIVDERALAAEPPAWCARRGWAPFLASLADDAVLAASRDGLAAHVARLPDAPRDLVALARAVRELTALPDPPTAHASRDAVDARRASPRKREQVAAFARLASRLARGAARVVDVGSGHGHLTRHLARAFGVPAEGWERDPARVAVAASLAGGARDARFVAVELRDAAGTLARADLLVGLHACGALGDDAVRAARAAGASVALVGCCLQKREGDRAPLSAAPPGLSPRALTLGHAVLGLGNARDGEQGVEDDLATRVRSRVHRIALGAALAAAGHAVAPGEEMRGVNRRHAAGAFVDLAARAFAARGLALPSRAALAEAERAAHAAYERARRWELPRAMLARLVEVWVALDRAAYLAAGGYDARVVLAFDASASPRNVAVLAAPAG